MNVATDRSRAIAAGAVVLELNDERYPPLLRTIHDPPQRLYVRGQVGLLPEPQLAIVGSRRASAGGLRLAQLIASQAVAAGLGICSGLALGIDAAAHRGALAGGGSTIAVMATGIDRVYPARHRGLASELEAAGCLVTEYPPGTPPRRGNFPCRNRIISGLSLGVLVVEAALPSGSLITARVASEQGREVFALPWSILHEGGGGCLKLLRDGAKLVQSLEDIVEELGPMYSAQHQLFSDAREAGRDHNAGLDTVQSQVLGLLGYEVIGVDELCHVAQRSMPELMSALSALELKALIERVPGGYIRR